MIPPGRKIKVHVVDDSAVSRDLLTHILTSDPRIEVMGHSCNGEEAIAALGEKSPDVVTMDIHMPGMDGFEVTRKIMETRPLPIVIVSVSFDPADVSKMFQALEAGAVAAVEKPSGPGHPAHLALARKLIDTVTAMSEVRVIRRWSRARMAARTPEPVALPRDAKAMQLVAIGASTGGPPVLQTILSALPKPCPVPIVIVQHISAGFVQGLADWLTQCTGIPVHIASHGERAMPGCAYLAPDDRHLCVEPGMRLVLTDDPVENGSRPAVSNLFRSVARVCGTGGVGVILTGMGRDGAEELKLMRDRGAVTIAQDEETSVVFGMPGEAVKLGAATHVSSPQQIGALLSALLKAKPRP
jgi:two-component system chemotaxis response regulator CheB